MLFNWGMEERQFSNSFKEIQIRPRMDSHSAGFKSPALTAELRAFWLEVVCGGHGTQNQAPRQLI
jgi:hypothetical protein